MKKLSSLILAGAASLALLAAPALAQNAPMNPPSGSMSGSKGGMGGMAMPKKTMAKKKASKSMAMAGSMKLGCMDYAWQSQDEKDCEAGKIKPPHNR